MASSLAGASRLVFQPLDTWETLKQVEGKDGFGHLVSRARKDPRLLWRGSGSVVMAGVLGHYTWFYTHNKLSEMVAARSRPGATARKEDGARRLALRAGVGFASGAVSDACCNGFFVLKTIRQTSVGQPAPYRKVARRLIAREGLLGFLGRGLCTKVLASGLQSAIFTIGWRAMVDFTTAHEVEGVRDHT